MTDWQPIETAPKDETFVLTYGPHGVDMAAWDAHWEGGCWVRYQTAEYDNDFAGVAQPSHWMPLPAPPEASDK